MKRLLLIFPLFVLNSMAGAQKADSCSFNLKGVILDADTKEALPYVQVKVKGTQHFSLTDNKGEFHFDNLCNEFNTLILSCLGYCDTICENFHQHGKSPHIYLEQDVRQLGSVTITAQKRSEEGTLSFSQQALDKTALSVDPTKTLASALSDLEGVAFTSSGTHVQLPLIHGLYGNRLLILNNGVKHGFQNWGKDHAPEIDISTVNSIGVIKGAAGVRYGPEALAGAIVVKADPLYLRESLRIQTGTGYQTNGRGYFINTEIGQGLKKWSYHLGANYTSIGDAHAPGYSLTNSGKNEKSINAGLRYHLENWDFQLLYSYVNQNLGLLRSSVAHSANSFERAISSDEPIIINPFSYTINEPNQLTNHHLGKVEISWWYSDEAKLTFRYGRQLNKRKEFDVRRNADRPIIDLDLTTNDYQLEWKHPDRFKLDGLVGLQVFTQNNDNNPGTHTTPFIPNYNTWRFSGFIIESLTRNKNTFELGVRFDYEHNSVRGRETNQDIFRDDFSFTNLTSSLGYIRQLSDNTTFRTNLGTAWRTPNMAELYSFGQHGFKTSYGLLRYYTSEEGELRTDKVIPMAERQVSPEKGYKWINEWQTGKKENTYTLTAYSHYIQNFIFDRPIGVFGTIRGPMPGFIFDQADALFMGIDLTWQKNWSNALNGAFGISYLWSRNLTRNEPLINQPPTTTSYKLTWIKKAFWKFESSSFSIKPSYTFRQFQAPSTIPTEDLINGSADISPNTPIFDFKDAPKGYFLLDMAWNIELRHFETSVSVQNIFNTSYRSYLNDMRYFADETGRNMLLTIRYKFNSKSNK